MSTIQLSPAERLRVNLHIAEGILIHTLRCLEDHPTALAGAYTLADMEIRSTFVSESTRKTILRELGDILPVRFHPHWWERFADDRYQAQELYRESALLVERCLFEHFCPDQKYDELPIDSGTAFHRHLTAVITNKNLSVKEVTENLIEVIVNLSRMRLKFEAKISRLM
jgi:hypothetical protein